MRQLTPVTSENLLVGATSGDDAAVYRLTDDRALVFTADFITPVVDDAYDWGRVAAANAVSDVYAMGGTPLVALNLVCWNTEELSTDLLADVMRGGQDIGEDCGFIVAGGHTIDDPEPKYGMAVIGEVHPDQMLTNAGLFAGQVLILTKPLGIGVITTALKRGVTDDETVAAAVTSMTQTNAVASRIAVEYGATGATDVTGFGLLGHAGRMAEESKVGLKIIVDDVPIISGARELALDGIVPGGTGRNLGWIRDRLDLGAGVDNIDITLLADAQTSGGLVFGVEPDAATDVLSRLIATGHTASIIGRTVSGHGRISIVRDA